MTAPPLISSTTNARIKQVRALGRRKEREAAGLCVVEGIFHVGEALASGAAEYLIYAPDILASPFGRELVARAESSAIPTYAVTTEVMESVAGKDNPQGLLAVARQRLARLEDLSAATHPWMIALIAPQDPGNVGTILRTIDAVGASGLMLVDGGVDPYHPSAIRAGMGAIFRIPVATATWSQLIHWVRREGYHLAGTSAHGRDNYRDTGLYTPPVVLLLGSEREGLTAEQTAACDVLMRLPMHGRASSLNLAVAAGVFLYAMHDSMAANTSHHS
ncbi:MAG TPA: RNA methyltransferase [Promineifilum sp.]|nr:RNA methyltransferase [Promineifilum sp.]HRO90428.1 RNA methyltransferase [Promineifilum sp.]HRQ14300.1 RNA methyltransferase [Promineifilum sp.]